MSYRRSFGGFGSIIEERTSVELSTSELIIFYINNGKLADLKKRLTTSNINDIIESKLGYRALDYAIKCDNKEIIDFILSLGADPYLLNGVRKNAFAMSRDHMSNHMALNIIDSKDAIIKDKTKTITTLEKCIANLESSKKYMLESIDTLNATNSKFKSSTTELKSETRHLKDEVSTLTVQTRSMTTKINELERQASSIRADNTVLRESVRNLHNENNVLQKENTTLKRKYADLEESFDTLFHNTKNTKK